MKKTNQNKKENGVFSKGIQIILPIVVGGVFFYLLHKFLRTMPVHYKEGMVTTSKLHMVDLLTLIPCLFLVFGLKEALKYSIKIGFLLTGFVCFGAIFLFHLFSNILLFAGLVFWTLAAAIYFFEILGKKNTINNKY